MELTELSSVKEDEEKAIYDRLTDLGYLESWKSQEDEEKAIYDHLTDLGYLD